LTLEARRIALTTLSGLHGRRRAGPGESFWQFRAFAQGEAAQRIDWRRELLPLMRQQLAQCFKIVFVLAHVDFK
jgi:hypothetical protein